MKKSGFIDLDMEEMREKAIAAGIPEEMLNFNKTEAPANLDNKVPLGYLPFELSTKGKLGVPATIHVRNFTAWELLNLSMLNDDLLPEQMINALNNIIYEDVDVANFPEKVVIEILVKVHANYYGQVISDLFFPWNEEDLTKLEVLGKADLAQQIRNRKYRPKIDFNLTWLSVDTLDTNITDKIRIRKGTKGSPDFVDASFVSYPKYGDSVKLSKWLETEFAEEEKTFEVLKRNVEVMDQYVSEGRDISGLPILSEQELTKYQLFQIKRIVTLGKAQFAQGLLSLNGVDLSNNTLIEKIKAIDNNSSLSLSLAKKLNAQYSKIQFGINPEVELTNPLTKEVCKRNFTFRVRDLVQTLQSSELDDFDIGYDD